MVNSNGILSMLGIGRGTAIAAGQPTTGWLLYSDASISLGSSSVSKVQTNIIAPNGFHCHNLAFALTVTDTTGTTAPSSVNSIESVIQDFTITGASGKVLCKISGVNGEFQRWQHRLNSANQYYVVAGTPSDTSTSTSYSATFNFNFKDWIIPQSEFPIAVRVQYNTLASRATTLNAMTSAVTSFQVFGDFVALTGGTPTMLRTKMITTSTGIVDFGANVDRTAIFDMALDVAADTNLSHTNTFNVAVNNSSLLNNSDYQNIYTRESTVYPIAVPHIDGFFPFMTLIPAVIDGNQRIVVQANISTAPTIGGNKAVVNLYMLEQY